MKQVALADVLADVGLDRLREDRDFVPVRVFLPLTFVVLEGIVGADADADCLADLLDGSDPTDGGEFGDVAHCLSPSCGAAPRCDGDPLMAGKTKQSRSPRDAGGGQAKSCAPAGTMNFGAEGACARNADRGPRLRGGAAGGKAFRPVAVPPPAPKVVRLVNPDVIMCARK